MNKEQKELHLLFRKKKWPYWEPQWILARLTEEVGEFARAVNHEFGPKKNKNDEHASGLEDELGDILYTLACFANAHGINLDNAMEKSIKKVQLRDKNRF